MYFCYKSQWHGFWSGKTCNGIRFTFYIFRVSSAKAGQHVKLIKRQTKLDENKQRSSSLDRLNLSRLLHLLWLYCCRHGVYGCSAGDKLTSQNLTLHVIDGELASAPASQRGTISSQIVILESQRDFESLVSCEHFCTMIIVPIADHTSRFPSSLILKDTNLVLLLPHIFLSPSS